jgi:hypothetical protein
MVKVSRWAQVFLTQSLIRPDAVFAIADLGDDALQAGLAGVLGHLLAVDLKALAELDIGVGDHLLEQCLAIDQR